MKITKSQIKQMIREALSTDEADVQKMVDVYIKQFGGVDKIKKFTKGNNKEEKIQYTIKNLQSRFDKIPFDLVNKAAVQIVTMYGGLDERENKMKISVTELRKILKEKLIKEKKDREAFTGDIDLRGGEAVSTKLPEKMDAVIYNIPNYETDSRDYFYGIVVDVEDLDRRNSTGGNPLKVLPLFMAGQTKKGSAAGEVTEPEAIENPKTLDLESNEVNVLRDQDSWKKKLAAQLKLKAAEKRSRM